MLHKTDGSHTNRLLFFLEEKKQKKIVCGSAYFCAFAAFANLQHKTDGSHTNRPFLCPKQDVRESVFPQINHLSRSVFCFFSSRKEIVPLLFFLEEKPVGMRGKRRPSDGRTQAHPALSSVGIPQRVCLPPPPCLCPCPPRLRATQNGCLLFFLEEKKQKKIVCGSAYFCAFAAFANLQHKTDGSHTNRPFLCPKQDVRESVFPQINHLSRSVFCFFSSKKENVPL